MNLAYLLLGSNLYDKERNLNSACQLISLHCGTILKASSLFETEPWGNKNQPSFLNQALLLRTHYEPDILMDKLMQIEETMGRIRKEKYAPRLIDIDILLYNSAVIQSKNLQIPHPQMHKRRFALSPLAEIAPQVVHPVFNKTIRSLLEECEDLLQVKKIL